MAFFIDKPTRDNNPAMAMVIQGLFLNRYPRRTGEVMLAQNIDCEFVHENRPPADANFSQLWAWHRPLIEQERVCAPPEVGRTESGHGG